MDDIRRLMESSVDLGSVSDPQAEIERRIERNGLAYLMKGGAVYAVVLSERRLRTSRGQEGVDLALARVAGEAATGHGGGLFMSRRKRPEH